MDLLYYSTALACSSASELCWAAHSSRNLMMLGGRCRTQNAHGRPVASQLTTDSVISNSRESVTVQLHSLSARFPGITPHVGVSKAWLPEVDLVDGGYEDNSGAETLLGVLKDIINVSGELEQWDDLGEVPAVQVSLLLPFYFDVSTESCPPQKIRSHDFGQSRKGFVA
jgi:hypothetical protein